MNATTVTTIPMDDVHNGCNHDHGHDHHTHTHDHDASTTFLPSSVVGTRTKTTTATAAATITTTARSNDTTNTTSTLNATNNTGTKTSRYLDHRHENTIEMQQQQQVMTKLYYAIAIITFFLVIEIVGGYMAKSLSIWSDAAHLVSDLAALLVAQLAAHVGSFPVSTTHTYGLKRVESLAALFSTMSLLGISVWLAMQAIQRIYLHAITAKHSFDLYSIDTTAVTEVNGRLMSLIAFMGVLVNLMLAYVLGEHHVHLPTDDNHHCISHNHGHGHDHDHDHSQHTHSHHHDEEDHNHENEHDQEKEHNHNHNHNHLKTIAGTSTGCATSSSSYSCSNSHDHSHQHPTEDVEHGGHSESTPLLQQAKVNATAASATATSTTTTTDTVPPGKAKSQQWNIPFRPQNINLQAAYLHVLGDLLQSITVLFAGCIIWVFPSATLIDPICTLLFCIFVFYSAYAVCRTSIAVLLQQVPTHLNFDLIRDKIAAVPHVNDVHDLHIWSISHRVPALTVHCSIDDTVSVSSVADSQNGSKSIHDEVLENIYKIVRFEFDIIHATIQIQSMNGDCVTCADRLCRPCLLHDTDTPTTTLTLNETMETETITYGGNSNVMV
jgi:solute carrier family 30 (zinc transporter), member 2